MSRWPGSRRIAACAGRLSRAGRSRETEILGRLALGARRGEDVVDGSATGTRVSGWWRRSVRHVAKASNTRGIDGVSAALPSRASPRDVAVQAPLRMRSGASMRPLDGSLVRDDRSSRSQGKAVRGDGAHAEIVMSRRTASNRRESRS